jgi:Na+/melibiose symporter-like transporter
MTGTVSNTIRAAYGIGRLCNLLVLGGVSVFLLYFYTDVVGITPSAAEL